MKNFLSFLKFENLKNNLKEVIKRFPVSLIIIFIVAILFFILNHGDFTNITKMRITGVVLSLMITFFASVGLYLSAEGLESKEIEKNLLQIVAFIFGFLLYFGFDHDIQNIQNIVFFVLTLSGLVSYLFFAPYIRKLFVQDKKQIVFYTYFYNVSVVFLTSIILGVVLFILGLTGINAVFELFGGSWSWRNIIIQDWSIISLLIISPIFALFKLPNKKSFLENRFNENIFFSFLIKAVTIPFIYVYFIILYAYSIKVLANFSDWPKGEISWLVVWFSVFGYIGYIYSYIFEEKNKFIRFFRKMFPYVVFPQIFMLLYAIYLRIAQYDLTINRYFVVVFGLWLLTISIYYIFSKKKYLSTIFSVLTIFIIIISIGPWSVYNLSEKRQYKALISNLEKASILKDGEIIPLKNYDDIDENLSRSIYSGIGYLCELNNCNTIKTLFKKQYIKLLEKNKKEFEAKKQKDEKKYKDNKKMLEKVKKRKYIEISKSGIVKHITDSIKVMNYYPDREYINKASISLYLKDHERVFPIETSGYSKIVKLLGIGNSVNTYYKIYAKINLKNRKIEVIMDDEIIESIDITEMINNLTENYKNTKNTRLSKDEMTYDLGKYKVILENISLDNPENKLDDENIYYYANGYLLIK